LAADKSGTLTLADTENGAIRRITDGWPSRPNEFVVRTLAGGSVESSELYGTNVLVTTKTGFADGVGSSALFNAPAGVAVDQLLNVFVSELWSGKIRKITQDGIVTTLPIDLTRPESLAVDGSGNLWVVTGHDGWSIRNIHTNGVVKGVYMVRNAIDLAVDGVGNVYVLAAEDSIYGRQEDNIFRIEKMTRINRIDPVDLLRPVTYSEGLTLTLRATASSGLPVKYNSSSSNVWISNNTVKVLGAGTAEIVASEPGNSFYPAAVPWTYWLEVNKGNAAVTITGTNAVSNGKPRSVTVKTVPAELSTRVTYNGSTNLPTRVGRYDVQATVTDPNYEGSNAAIFNIVAPTNTNIITFPALPSATYREGLTLVLRATASSGLPVRYNSSSKNVSISNNTVKVLGAGSAEIVASEPGNSIYPVARPVTKSLVIAKAPQAITFKPASLQKYKKGRKVTLSATATSQLAVTFKSSEPKIFSISGRTATILGKGKVTITASQSGNANFLAASSVKRTITIR
jgi:hypothetical protein